MSICIDYLSMLYGWTLVFGISSGICLLAAVFATQVNPARSLARSPHRARLRHDKNQANRLVDKTAIMLLLRALRPLQSRLEVVEGPA
jgi:hypothetical protein